MSDNRRKQYVINKPLQYKIIGYLALLLTGIIAAFGLALGFSQAVINQPAAITATPTNPGIIDMLWLPIIITFILAIIAALLIGLFYSHRIAGPLFNLKRVLNQIENGLIDKEMSIRSKDELHDVQDAVNAMISGLNVRIKKIKAACIDLSEKDKRKLNNIINEQFKCRDN